MEMVLDTDQLGKRYGRKWALRDCSLQLPMDPGHQPAALGPGQVRARRGRGTGRAVVYGLGMSWWLTPLSQAGQGRLSTLLFDMQGVVPIGCTLFAVALGIFASTIWHKVLPAMAVTLVGFLGIRVALTTLARPRYLPARVLTFPVQGATAQPNMPLGDWVGSTAVRDASGKAVQANAEVACPPGAEGPGGGPCGARLGLGPGSYNRVLYQPADRFWAFQGVETGIFVALAVLLLYLAIRRIRRIA